MGEKALTICKSTEYSVQCILWTPLDWYSLRIFFSESFTSHHMIHGNRNFDISITFSWFSYFKNCYKCLTKYFLVASWKKGFNTNLMSIHAIYVNNSIFGIIYCLVLLNFYTILIHAIVRTLSLQWLVFKVLNCCNHNLNDTWFIDVTLLIIVS